MQSCSLTGDEMAVFYFKEFIAGLYSRYDLYVQKYNSRDYRYGEIWEFS